MPDGDFVLNGKMSLIRELWLRPIPINVDLHSTDDGTSIDEG
jgi:hypothetical protein